MTIKTIEKEKGIIKRNKQSRKEDLCMLSLKWISNPTIADLTVIASDVGCHVRTCYRALKRLKNRHDPLTIVINESTELTFKLRFLHGLLRDKYYPIDGDLITLKDEAVLKVIEETLGVDSTEAH